MGKSVLQDLYNEKYWTDTLIFFESRSFRQKEKLKVYKSIVENREFIQIADKVLAGKYFFTHPLKLVVNKFQTGKKKTVYLFDYQDDFLLKVINRILTEEFAAIISPVCHSFQKQKGAKTAFRSLLKDPEINNKHCLKTDIRNFFNSIDTVDFIEHLPIQIKNDVILFDLIRQLLFNKVVRLGSDEIIDESKGLMAGCPLSPFLTNIYLRDLDSFFYNNQITYMRYSDDIVIFDFEDKIQMHFEYIKNYLTKKKLEINSSKTVQNKAGELVVFLGFSYQKGKIDLSSISVQKMKDKIRRLSRSFRRGIVRKRLLPEEALIKFIIRINRKLYGIDARENDLCWAHWFFPVINSSDSIAILDEYIQQRLRYSVTGKYNAANFKKVPYQVLKKCGYIPLKKAYYAFKTNYEEYLDLLHRKSG
jgi:RNA-directed DNA polymerase